jgi:hypothetical protein
MMKESDDFRGGVLKMIDQEISNSGFSSLSAEELFAEVFADIDKYDLVKHAGVLSRKDILIIGGWRDEENPIEHHILPLFRALQRHEAKQVQIEIFDTGHSFSNVRTQLANRIVFWLKQLPTNDKTESQVKS